MSKGIITIKSGKEEIQMEVTEEEYRNYFCLWWLQKKREQRNLENIAYTMAEHADPAIPDEVCASPVPNI